jgi:glycosyltransferase involved in cell wall biosynthesis
MLARALDSILRQTSRDFVLVIVNDSPERGPVDDLVRDVAGEIADRIVVVHNDEPHGRWGAMDTAIAAAESEYFILHDDDDSWHPTFLEETTAYLDTHADDSAVAVRTELIFEEVAGGTITELRRQLLATGLNTVSFVEMLKQNYVPPIALLLRRSVFAEIGTFDNSLPVLADWDFTLKLVSRFTVGFIDGEPLAYWHHRESSVGDEGNSVVADAMNHQRFNLRIRDTYLRNSVAATHDLGPLLLAAELFRQLDTKATEARREQSRVIHDGTRSSAAHLEVVHASIVTELAKLRSEVGQLSAEISHVRAELAAEPFHRKLLSRVRGAVTSVRARRRG